MSIARSELNEQRAETVLRAIVILYLVLGALYAVLTPAWQVPDEPAHYNYVEYVRQHGSLPELRVGDFPAAYLEEIKAKRFPPDMPVEALRYESHQPPLYYVLAAGVYRLAHDMLSLPMPLALRAFSLLLGAASLIAAYRLVRALCPGEPVLALGTVAFAATLPMHLSMTAAVNNDVLAELLVNVIIWQLVAMNAGDWSPRRSLALGALLGLAFMTKMQSYVALGVAAFALLWDTLSVWRDGRGAPASADRPSRWRGTLLQGGILLGAMCLISLPWLARNAALYGPGDLFALARHDQVVAGQLTSAQYVAQHGWSALVSSLVVTTFHSFWAQFGWMGVVLPDRVYLTLALLSALAAIGFALRLWRMWRSAERPPRASVRGLALLLLWAALTTLGYLWWNTRFLQHQGRYLFPALVPWGLAFTLGLRELLRRPLGPTLAAFGIASLALLAAGLIGGDVRGFSLALLAGAAALTALGHWLEQRWPGLPLACVYLGLAAFAAFCVYGYIIPNLRP